jgi:phage regulator Rha-like protein
MSEKRGGDKLSPTEIDRLEEILYDQDAMTDEALRLVKEVRSQIAALESDKARLVGTIEWVIEVTDSNLIAEQCLELLESIKRP